MIDEVPITIWDGGRMDLITLINIIMYINFLLLMNGNLLNNNNQFAEDPYRYIVTIIFYFIGVLTNVIGTSHSNSSIFIGQVFNGSETQAYILSIAPLISLVFTNFPANYIIDKHGLRISILICAFSLLLGSCLKMLIEFSFNFVILGHFICYISCAFLNNCSAKVSSTWYNAENRINITSVLISSLLLGFAGGYLLNIIFFADFNISLEKNSNYNEEIKKSVIFLNFKICLLLSVAGVVVCYFFYQEKPKNAPSKTATLDRQNFADSFKMLFFDKNYIKLSIYYGLIESNFEIFGFMIYFIFVNFSTLNSGDIYTIGFILNFSSAISLLLYGVVIGNKCTLKLSLIYITFAMIATLFILYLALISNNLFLIYICTVLYGLTINAYIGPCFELASEIVFPVSEEQAVGGMTFLSFVFGIILSFIIERLYDAGYSPSLMIFILFGVYVLSYFFIASVKEDLKRKDMDENNIQMTDFE